MRRSSSTIAALIAWVAMLLPWQTCSTAGCREGVLLAWEMAPASADDECHCGHRDCSGSPQDGEGDGGCQLEELDLDGTLPEPVDPPAVDTAGVPWPAVLPVAVGTAAGVIAGPGADCGLPRPPGQVLKALRSVVLLL